MAFFKYFPKIGYDCNGDELTVENDKPHSDYSLLNVTPNPFNSVIRLNYRVKENDRIKIMIYDITGKKICTLRNGFHSRGFYSISWDANKYSSGIYIVKLFFTCFNYAVSAVFLGLKLTLISY